MRTCVHTPAGVERKPVDISGDVCGWLLVAGQQPTCLWCGTGGKADVGACDRCSSPPPMAPSAGALILYDDRYQPAPNGGGEKPPTFAAEENYGQYIYVYRNGVRTPNRNGRMSAAHGQRGVLTW